MVTCGDTGLPVLACLAVYGSLSLSVSGEDGEEELLKTRRMVGAVAAAANGRPCMVQSIYCKKIEECYLGNPASLLSFLPLASWLI